MGSDLFRRLAVAALGIPLCVAFAAAGGLAFAAGLGALGAVAAWEVGRMVRSRGEDYLFFVGVALAGSLPLVVGIAGSRGAWLLTVAAMLIATGYAALRIPPARRPFRTAATTMAGALYVGGLLSFGVPLRESLLPGRVDGTLLFFLPVAVTWLADTAAYSIGRSVGRHRLAPVVSPNKTVEGAVAGLVAGPAGALIYGVWILPGIGDRLGWTGLATLGLLVSAAAVVGDLVESSLKRECGVKDSSNLLPGHGGLLDRMDSLLWSIPVAYLFLSTVG